MIPRHTFLQLTDPNDGPVFIRKEDVRLINIQDEAAATRAGLLQRSTIIAVAGLGSIAVKEAPGDVFDMLTRADIH